MREPNVIRDEVHSLAMIPREQSAALAAVSWQETPLPWKYKVMNLIGGCALGVLLFAGLSALW